MTNIPNFKSTRLEILNKAAVKYKGAKDRICVPIKYQLFRKIDLDSSVWKSEYDVNVFEEAVQFCITILDDHATQVAESKKQKPVHFVENQAMAS